MLSIISRKPVARAIMVGLAVFFFATIAHDLNVYFRINRDADILSLLVGEREPYLFKYIFGFSFFLLAVFRLSPPKEAKNTQ